MKKRSLVMAMALVTAVSGLTACGSSGKTETAAPETTAAEAGKEASSEAAPAEVDDKGYHSTYDVSSAGDVKLDVMITSLGDSDGGPFLRGVMDKYMEMYPNVTLNPVECSMNDLYTTLITQTTAGTLPDIFTMSEAYSANCLEMAWVLTTWMSCLARITWMDFWMQQ